MLSELPSNWKWVTAQDYIDIRDGTHDSPKPVEAGIPLVTSKNLVSGEIDFSTCTFISEQDHEAISRRSKVDDGDILYAMIGTIGNPVIVAKQFDFSIKNVALFKFNDDSVLNRYIYYFLNNPIAEQQFKANSRGGTQKFVSLGNIRDLKIPLPPLAEQKRIAAILDKADAIRRKRQQAIQLADDFLRSVFLDMFGDPVTNPKKIKTVQLSELCNRVTDGTHQSPKWSAEGCPFLFVSNIVQGEIDFNTQKFISEDTHKELTRRCPIEVGDVLYSTVGSYGIPVVVNTERKFAFQRHIAHLKPDLKLIMSEFLVSMLASSPLKRQADSVAKGVAQKTVNLQDIKQFTVFQPTLEQQHNFVKIAEKIKTQKARYKLKIAESNNLFNSLSQKAFSGQL